MSGSTMRLMGVPWGSASGSPAARTVRAALAALGAVALGVALLTVATVGMIAATPWHTAAAQHLPPAGLPLPEHDNAIYEYSQLRLDAARRNGSGEASLDGEGWVGTDFNRLWWNTSLEREGGAFDRGSVQLLYGHYVRQFFDAQIGYRRVLRPGRGNYLVAGFQGLAPYRFEVAAWGALSDRGRVSLRGETAYELLWTQRLISRPSVTADVFTSSDPAYGQQSAGLGDVEVRLPLRYEFSRQFAPYVEARYSRRTAGEEALTAGLPLSSARASGDWTLRGGLWLVF